MNSFPLAAVLSAEYSLGFGVHGSYDLGSYFQASAPRFLFFL